jgi:hypothetical protein
MMDESKTMQVYGAESDVELLGERVKKFLPGGDKMSPEEALGFAQICIAQNLNPFAREVWWIPGRGPCTGIEGHRKMARKEGPYTAQPRMMTGEEREQHELRDKDIGAVCELYRPDQLMAAVRVNEAAGKIVIPIKPVLGIGIKRFDEKNSYTPNGRSPLWVAEKRAEADALRKAFDMPDIGYADAPVTEIPPEWDVVDDEGDMTFDEAQGMLGRNRAILRGEAIEQAAEELGAAIREIDGIDDEPQPIQNKEQFLAACNTLGITAADVKKVLGGAVTDWCERNNTSLDDALDEVREVCGK